MNTDKYILIHHKVVPEPDLEKWGKWMEQVLLTEKRVARTYFHKGTDKEIMISTVFLGLDHSMHQEPIQLFETLVFDGPLDDEMERCDTWVNAKKMHERMVKLVEEAEKKNESL